MTCRYCNSSKVRTSRFRLADLAQLLLLKYPVRCRKCRERQYTGLITAMGLERDSHGTHPRRAA